MIWRRMRHPRAALLGAILFLPLLVSGVYAADPAPGKPVLSLTGKVKQSQQFDLDRLRALPSETTQVSFQTERGAQQSSYNGVLLWALLDAAGGIDDPEKGAALRHVIKITAKDG
jgi:hypothetical protein